MTGKPIKRVKHSGFQECDCCNRWFEVKLIAKEHYELNWYCCFCGYNNAPIAAYNAHKDERAVPAVYMEKQ
jgi:hypothetical protein